MIPHWHLVKTIVVPITHDKILKYSYDSGARNDGRGEARTKYHCGFGH